VASNHETWNVRLYPSGVDIGEVRVEGSGVVEGFKKNVHQSDVAAVREVLSQLSPSDGVDTESLGAIEDRIGEVKKTYYLSEISAYPSDAPETRLWKLIATIVKGKT
jgi:hypothetical protein